MGSIIIAIRRVLALRCVACTCHSHVLPTQFMSPTYCTILRQCITGSVVLLKCYITVHNLPAKITGPNWIHFCDVLTWNQINCQTIFYSKMYGMSWTFLRGRLYFEYAYICDVILGHMRNNSSVTYLTSREGKALRGLRHEVDARTSNVIIQTTKLLGAPVLVLGVLAHNTFQCRP